MNNTLYFKRNKDDIYRHNFNLFSNSEKLVLDDVLLEPNFGIVESRNDVYHIINYIYTAPMDKVTNLSIYKKAILETDIVIPVLARPYLSEFFSYISECFKDEQFRDQGRKLLNSGFISIGVNPNDYEGLCNFIKENESHINVINVAIDIAHGYSNQALDLIKKLNQFDFINIMSGSICTPQAAEVLIDNRVRFLRVGIGGGQMCTTRLMTGIGVPNLSAIWEIQDQIFKYSDSFTNPRINIIADGGIKHPGDIVKYLGAGATACMIGTAFAGCIDSPAEIINGQKVQRGQASAEFQIEHYDKVRNDCAEGVERKIPLDVNFIDKCKWFHGGVRSATSYLGLDSISDINPSSVKFNKVSANAVKENYPII